MMGFWWLARRRMTKRRMRCLVKFITLLFGPPDTCKGIGWNATRWGKSSPLPRWPTKLMDQKGRHWQEGRCKDSKSTSSSRWTPLEDPEAQTDLRWASINVMKHNRILETSQHQNYHWLDQHPLPQFVIQILTTMFKMSNIFCCFKISLPTLL